MSPQQQVDVVDDPLGVHKQLTMNAAASLVTESMTYYQLADYIWSHRLSRYQ